ncbi:alpha/beta hydrolase [Amycolatopsis lurida]
MVTWSEVTRWEGAPLQEAVGAINAEYNKLVPASDDLRKLATPYGWTGEAAAAAATKVNELVDRLEAWAAELAAGRTAAANVGDAIKGIENGVSEVETLAAKQHFAIGDDGAVIDNGPPPDTRPEHAEAVANERKQIAAELADGVKQVIQSADDLDNDFCSVLDRILNHQVFDATTNDNSATSLASAGALGHLAGGLTIPPPPPEGATAAQNAAYWATLSDQQRRQLAMDHPGLVGPRDGFTGVHRDIANRKLLSEERTKIQAAIDELGKDPRAHKNSINVPSQKYEEMQQLQAKMSSLDSLEKMTTLPDGQPNPDRQLLLLDMSGERAQAAVSNGNIDTADHVAVFTPGMNSAVDQNMNGYVSDMGRIRDDAERMLDTVGNGTVATVTWLGYEPPTTSDPYDLGDVAGGAEAREGAHKLTSFYDGINESRAEDPHMTALGHSYGSLTTGLALHENTGVDDAVFFGSPGISEGPPANPAEMASEIDKLQLPDGHAYTLEADDDLVADIGNVSSHYGTDPGSMQGMNQLSTEEAISYDGRHLVGSSGHSEYTKVMPDGTNSTSNHNIAAIVAGTPQYAIPASA